MSGALTERPAPAPKALIFDVDGTLYHHTPVRLRLAGQLLAQLIRRPRSGTRTIRALRAYRRALEDLRNTQESDSVLDVSVELRRLASRATGIPVDEIERYVNAWMLRAPLPLLARARRAHVVEVCAAARSRRIQLAACSDYPAAAKLDGLGLSGFFDVVVTAQDADVGRVKPHPRGLHIVLARLGVAAHDAWYVGDRADVDDGAARAAGVTSVILSRRYTMAHLLQDISR
jgi:FMN phosphatase YigB (HAD superfamily)